jgi:hypothetical protein
MLEILKRTVKSLIYSLSLAFISLSIPRISTLFILVIPVIFKFMGYLRRPKYVLNSPIIIISVISLLLFTILNYSEVYFHGLDERNPISIVIKILVINTLFLTSICLDFKKMPFFPFNILLPNIALFSGGVIFVFLSVAKHTAWSFSIGAIIIQDRSVPSFWQVDADNINGPSMDIFSYLGLSLIGIVISNILYFRPWKKINLAGFIFFIGVFSLVCMSSYSSIALGARTPIIVFLVSIIATLVLIYLSNRYRFYEKKLFLDGLIGLIIFLLGEFLRAELSRTTDFFLDIGIGNRFVLERLETGRYDIWLAAINQMWKFPWGGRKMDLLGNNYVHNIWLDQLYDAGILPMLLLLIFHLVQIPIMIRFFRLRLPIVVHVFVLCTLIAFLGAFLQSAVIQASYLYFAMSCFFFGSVARFTHDFDVMSTRKLL